MGAGVAKSRSITTGLLHTPGCRIRITSTLFQLLCLHFQLYLLYKYIRHPKCFQFGNLSDKCVKSGTVEHNGQQLLWEWDRSDNYGTRMGTGLTAAGLGWEGQRHKWDGTGLITTYWSHSKH